MINALGFAQLIYELVRSYINLQPPFFVITPQFLVPSKHSFLTYILGAKGFTFIIRNCSDLHREPNRTIKMNFCYNLLDRKDVRQLLNSDFYPYSRGLKRFQVQACDTNNCNRQSGEGFCEDEIGNLESNNVETDAASALKNYFNTIPTLTLAFLAVFCLADNHECFKLYFL